MDAVQPGLPESFSHERAYSKGDVLLRQRLSIFEDKAVKKWATRVWGWIRHHRLQFSVMLIVVLVGTGCGLSWTVNLIRFGMPPPTGQNCGSIIHSFSPPARNTRADATLQVLTCFWHAYQSCQAATMSQTDAAADAGGTFTVTVEKRNDHCAIYGQEEAWANTQTKNTTFLCTQLSKEGDTLQFSNCDGVDDFVLVPRHISRFTTGEYESYLCGRVGGAPYAIKPQQVESCFFTAYKRCLDDAMLYDTLEKRSVVERDFIIDNHCGIVYLPGSHTATCASLELRADGLYFMQCGTDGDIFVPNAPPSTR